MVNSLGFILNQKKITCLASRLDIISCQYFSFRRSIDVLIGTTRSCRYFYNTRTKIKSQLYKWVWACARTSEISIYRIKTKGEVYSLRWSKRENREILSIVEISSCRPSPGFRLSEFIRSYRLCCRYAPEVNRGGRPVERRQHGVQRS